LVDLDPQRLRVVPQDFTAVSVTTAGEKLVSATNLGNLYVLDASLEEVGRATTQSPQTIRPLRATPDGHYVFHGGTGLGTMTCGLRCDFGSKETKWDHFIFPDQYAHESRAVAVSPNGKLVAFGFADGTVRLYGTESMQPVVILRPFSGEVRGLAFGGDDGRLVIASRDGDIAVEAVDTEIASLADKKARAGEIVGRALGFGL